MKSIKFVKIFFPMPMFKIDQNRKIKPYNKCFILRICCLYKICRLYINHTVFFSLHCLNS